MNGYGTDNMVKGAFLLTAAGFLSKLLSAGYRVPLQNLTGDIGFYVYQQIYPVLGIAMILALYGFPSAISRLAVREQEKGSELSFRGFYWPVFTILLVIAGFLALLLYAGAPKIGSWTGDENLTSLYRLAAVVFLLIPFTAFLRGVFQGVGHMQPTAVSQVGEQVVRVTVIIAAAISFAFYGGGIYRVGNAAVWASVAGSVMAFLILGIYFIRRRPFASGDTSIPWGYYIKSLVLFGAVFAMNHMVLLIIQLADAWTLLPKLLEYGFAKEEAMALKGIFDRGQPFIQLGTVLGSSFALALIPTVSRKFQHSEPVRFRKNILNALSLSVYIACGATIGLILIFPEVNNLLYKNTDGTIILQILVTAILFGSLAISGASILQGLGYMKWSALFIGVSFLLKWGLNILLVPLWGIGGGALATVGSLLFLFVAVFALLGQAVPDLDFFRSLRWRALILANLGMSVYIFLVRFGASFIVLEDRMAMLVHVGFVVITGLVVYGWLLIRFGALTEDQLAMMPFATIFIRFQKGRDERG